jgi:hypothetical protein
MYLVVAFPSNAVSVLTENLVRCLHHNPLMRRVNQLAGAGVILSRHQ